MSGCTACTSPEDVQVICLIHRRRVRASKPAAGGAALCVRRERRWPSFIIWRWAGPALDGWIHCPWRAPPLLLPPRRRRHTATLKSCRRRGRDPAAPGEDPARRRPRDRLNGPAGRAPRRAAASPPREPEPARRGVAARLGRALANHPRVASPRAGRALAAPRRGNGASRVGAVGGGSPDYPRDSSRARAAAQLIRAMWVKACGKLPRNSPLAGSISSE
jgi:hypothetical protein